MEEHDPASLEAPCLLSRMFWVPGGLGFLSLESLERLLYRPQPGRRDPGLEGAESSSPELVINPTENRSGPRPPEVSLAQEGLDGR